MRSLRKRIRELLKRKRQDIFLVSALYFLLYALVAVKGPFVATIFGLRLPVPTPHSTALPLTLILVFCLVFPKYLNMKRVAAFFCAAALAHILFFTPGPITDDQPPGKTPPLQIETSDDRDLLLISVGNLRPDRMSGYGAVRNTTLHIDRLAAGSLMFTAAYSNIPSTVAAHATIFTGLHASAHRAHDSPFAPLRNEAETLAERMRRAGWRTEAVVEKDSLPAALNLAQGFDRYDDSPTGLPGAVERAVRRLEENRERKFFLFFHTARLTPPFNPPAPYHTRYSPDYGGGLGYLIGPDTLAAITAGNIEITPADEEHIRALYDAELLYTDVQLGKLLSHLRASGLLKETVVVLLSDHGETLGERGAFGDSRKNLHEEALRIPLLIFAPGSGRQPGSGRHSVPHRVSLVDVLPTLLDLFHIPFDGEALHGESIVPLLSKDAANAPPGDVYAETGPGGKKAIIAGHHKFIREAEPEKPVSRFNTSQNLVYFLRGREFYDLETDPREQNNLVWLDSPRARQMEKRLNEIVDSR